MVRNLHIETQQLKLSIMKLIKTSLVALIATVGFFSSAQETTNDLKPDKLEATVATDVKSKRANKVTATKRAEELNKQVQLNEEQLTAVIDLFTKTENRKAAIKNENEAEKNKALNDLQIMENKALDEILTSTQKKVLSSPKATKTATSM